MFIHKGVIHYSPDWLGKAWGSDSDSFVYNYCLSTEAHDMNSDCRDRQEPPKPYVDSHSPRRLCVYCCCKSFISEKGIFALHTLLCFRSLHPVVYMCMLDENVCFYRTK
jgi:hypothetical protein